MHPMPTQAILSPLHCKTLVASYCMEGIIHKWNPWNPMGSGTIK